MANKATNSNRGRFSTFVYDISILQNTIEYDSNERNKHCFTGDI